MSTSRHTSLSSEIDGVTHIRGFNVTELLAKASFAEVIFLLLSGRRPNEVEAKAFNAVLVAAIDHGPLAPSADVARRVMAAGNTLQSAVAAGVGTLGDWHGGAISQAASLFQQASAKKGLESVTAQAEWVVTNGLATYKRLPGFGHRVYESDPRVRPLFDFCLAEHLPDPYIKLALAVEEKLAEVKGRRIGLNIDGAMAAILTTLGFSPTMQRGVFIIARTPGLVAQAEEQSHEPPVLRSEDEVDYTGPEVRRWEH